MASTGTPYTNRGRLPDVIAAIQFMSMHERSSLSCFEWAKAISGDHLKEDHWRSVFEAHSELFRGSPDDEDHYALIWRRALPRRYYRPGRCMLSDEDFQKLPFDKQTLVSRPPIPETQVKTLVEIAISLHAKQHDELRDQRWWFAPIMGFCGSVLGALIAATVALVVAGVFPIR